MKKLIIALLILFILTGCFDEKTRLEELEDMKRSELITYRENLRKQKAALETTISNLKKELRKGSIQ